MDWWRRSIRFVLAVAVAAIAAAGCGGDEGSEPAERDEPVASATAGSEQLLARLSAGLDRIDGSAEAIDLYDLAAARSQAGVEAEDRPALADPDLTADGLRFLGFEALALPFLSRAEQLAEIAAIEPGRVSLVARTNLSFGEPALAVVATTQPLARIEEELLAAGMERRGGLITAGPRQQVSYYRFIGQADDGVLVLGFDRRMVKAAMGGEGAPLSPAAEFLAGLEGAARSARFDLDDCPLGVAGEQELVPPRGTLFFVTAERPDPAGLRLGEEGNPSAPPLDRLAELGEPSVEGKTLRLSYTARDIGLEPVFLQNAVTGDRDYGYRC